MHRVNNKAVLFNPEPPVHVLMPVFNAAPYIKQALQSVFKQTYSHLKLLIYDDGSNDQSMQVVHRFIQENPALKNSIAIISGDINRGVGYARKQLLNYSKESNERAYFLWLDSDDQFINPDFIKNVIAQMKNTSADICLFNFQVILEDESQINNAQGLLNDKAKAEVILEKINHAAGECVSPLDLADLLNFTSLGCTKCYAPTVTLPTPIDCPFEDFVYMAALLNAGKITALPAKYEPIQFLRRSNSICGKRTEKNFSHDIPEQLGCFFETVAREHQHDTNNSQFLAMAAQFVENKLRQYTDTLEKLISANYPGLSSITVKLFAQKSQTLRETIQKNHSRTRPTL